MHTSEISNTFMHQHVSDAMAIYEREPCLRSFWDDLFIHIMSGFVLKTDKIFIMARPVNSKAPRGLIVDPIFPFVQDEWDCWHMHVVAGDITHCWDYFPYRLKYVSWELKNQFRIYEHERIINLIKQNAERVRELFVL